MLDVTRRRRILGLSLPIIGGMISQNVLNLVDTYMVGQLGDVALGAVVMGGFLTFTAGAVLLGMGSAVQAMSARRVGAGQSGEAALPLNGGLLTVGVLSIPWSVLLAWAAPFFFPWVADDPAVAAEGVPYLQARLCALIFATSNVCFRGFWNAVDRPQLYMRTLIVMHLSNIALNWVLIFGHLGAPALGATGAGVASALSTVIGTGTYVVLAKRHARGMGFLSARPSMTLVRDLLRLAMPAGFQQVFFAAGLTAFSAIVARVGTAELAATGVLANLMLVARLPGLGFGLAAASLVGQALGAGSTQDARAWGWDVSKMAACVVALIGLPAILFPETLLRFFITVDATVQLAVPSLRIVAVFVGLDAIGLVLMNALLGAGASRRVMFISVGMQWGVFLPLAYLMGPVFGLGLTAIWALNVGQLVLQMLIYAFVWRSDGWARLRVG